jgi:hypothetical protein
MLKAELRKGRSDGSQRKRGEQREVAECGSEERLARPFSEIGETSVPPFRREVSAFSTVLAGLVSVDSVPKTFDRA